MSRGSRFTLAGLTAAVALALSAPATRADEKPALHSPVVDMCWITHDPVGMVDTLLVRAIARKKDREAIRKMFGEDRERAGTEVVVALNFLFQSAQPAAVVDGSDSSRLNKKGVGEVQLTFNSFGTYEVDITERAKGFRPSHSSFKFSVTNTNGGACTIVG